jgi:ligand-binding sensor domain-containing protein
MGMLRGALLLIAAAIPARVYALDPAKTLTQYVHRIWQVQQGLPQASVYAIVQTRDGFLWLGTETGLVKFDGVRFTTIDDWPATRSLRWPRPPTTRFWWAPARASAGFEATKSRASARATGCLRARCTHSARTAKAACGSRPNMD